MGVAALALALAGGVVPAAGEGPASGPATAPTPAPASRPAEPLASVDEIRGRVDDFLTRMSEFGYSGNVLIIRRGTVVLKKGYGLADRAGGKAYDAETIFDIGSMAKQFTAAAVMRLSVDGRLTVDDPIGKFIDHVPDDKRAITIHQLLTHTAGVASDFPYTDPALQYEDVDRDEAIRRILKAPLEYPPGTDKNYSNGGYVLLAAVVERASGQPFCEYIRRAILAPAGMKHTGFWADPSLDASKVAIGYNEYGEPLHDPMHRSATTWQDLGGGQMLSTLDDLERWREALASGRVVPADAVARMWKPWTTQLSARDGDYGYGWFIQHKTTPRPTLVLQHGGDYLGTGAEFAWYRDEEVVVITSTNVRHDMYPTRNRTDRVIPKILFGGEFTQPPAWASDERLMKACAGSYRLPTGGTLTIHERGGRFFIGADGQDAADLLVPSPANAQARRQELTAKSQRAADGLCAGDPGGLKELAGGAAANPAFVDAVVKEITSQGRGAMRAAHVLGTFPSGFPRGHPLDYETTLIRFDFAENSVPYAIRWANEHIAATEYPAFRLAADTAIQPDGKGGLVAWNIVFQAGVTFSPRPGADHVDALVVHAPGGDVIAKRSLQAGP